MPSLKPAYEILDKKFEPDPNKTGEANKQAIKDLYQLDMSRSEVKNLIGEGIAHPERFMRSSAEQREARRLMEQMQENIANDLVMRPLFNQQMREMYPGSRSLGRCTIFYRMDSGDGAEQFNEALANAETRQDERAVVELMIQEATRILDKFNIKQPQDVMKLYSLTDRQLTEDYSDLRRLPNLLTELIDGDGSRRYASGYTPEQKEFLAPFKAIQDLFPFFMTRCDLIANPLYAEYDYARMLGEGIDPSKIHDVLADHLGNEDEASNHPAEVFFNQNHVLHSFLANSFQPRVEALEPALKDAVYHDDGMATFLTDKPLLAYGTDGKQYVMTNTVFMDKIPTVPEYMQTLSERGAKANKWLLTGSKEFDDMMELWNRLQLFQADPSSRSTDLKNLTNDVKEAALKYFEHKQVDIEKNYLGHASLHGKNKREQSRLEVAADIFAFAQAESTMLEKVAELKAAKAKASKPERMADHVLRVVNPDVISADGKQKFVESLPDKISTLFEREPPLMQKVETKMEGGKEIKKVTSHRVIEQDEFSALCALATGSPQAHYNVPVLDKAGNIMKDPVTGKNLSESRMNKNPEETYKNTLTAIMGSHTVNNVPRELGRMLRGATTTTSRAIEYGRFDSLGQMLADGLKLNNKMMQEMQSQKRFTPEFYACAKLAANALNVMEKPEFKGLKTIVESQLSAEDLQTAKACQGIYNVISDGIHAQKMLASRFTMSDKAKAFDRGDGGILDDMAKLCHMYGMERQFASGNLKLDNCNYGKHPDFTKQTNEKLAGDKNISAFVDGLEKMELDDQFKAIKNPKEMANLCQEGMNHIKEAVQQQIQAQQPQLQLNIVQPQPQPQAPLPLPMS